MSGHVSPEVLEGLCDLLRRGAPLPTACDVVQIKLSTVLGWIDKGTPDPSSGNARDGYYATAADRLRIAMAKSELDALQLVLDAARGYEITEEEEHFNAEGALSSRVVSKKRKRDWRAAAWYLERVHGNKYAGGDRAPVIDAPQKEIVINAPESLILEMRTPLEHKPTAKSDGE